jgi:hypothetical protein
MGGRLFGLVSEKVSNLSEELDQGIPNASIGDDFIGRGLHQFNPAVPLGGPNLEGHVPATKSGVSPFDEIPLISSEPEEQKIPQALLGARPIIIGIHRTDEIIGSHFRIKHPGQLRESLLAESRVD